MQQGTSDLTLLPMHVKEMIGIFVDWCLVLVVVQSQLFSVRGVLCDSTAARAHCGVSLLVAEYTPPFFLQQQQRCLSSIPLSMTDESALPFNVPNWVSYLLSFTGLAGLTGAALLYLYQCEIIYPSSFPEGSRTQVTLWLL